MSDCGATCSTGSKACCCYVHTPTGPCEAGEDNTHSCSDLVVTIENLTGGYMEWNGVQSNHGTTEAEPSNSCKAPSG